MSENVKILEADERTDAQKFEDALRKMFATPKEDVEARIEADRELRKSEDGKNRISHGPKRRLLFGPCCVWVCQSG